MPEGIRLAIEVVPVDPGQVCAAARSLFEATGLSTTEARLSALEQTSACVTFSSAVSAQLLQKARWEQISVSAGNQRTTMSGSLLGWQCLLRRWPAQMASLGMEIATRLGLDYSAYNPVKHLFEWGTRPYIMGIVNATPNSFSDGGRYLAPEDAVEHGLELAADGADILDIGGESTRPGAPVVPAVDEMQRVVPVIRELARQTYIPISVDTYKPEVAAAALDAGASIINDISGLSSLEMRQLAARTGAPVVMMHMQGEPSTMQQNPTYRSVVAEVFDWLEAACSQAEQDGVSRQQIILDPGIGFGKTTAHNLEILRRARLFRLSGLPLLIGTSKKSMIGNVLELPVDERQEGTAATVAAAVMAGADIVRVHDVKAMRRVAKMTKAVYYGE